MSDETFALLQSVEAELSGAQAQLTARQQAERAELSALTEATEKFTQQQLAAAGETRKLSTAITLAEDQRRHLYDERARLQERLQAALWSSSAIVLMLGGMIPLAVLDGRPFWVAVGSEAAALGVGWLLGGIGRARG